MGTALIIVDVQNDFCEGGSLPVAGGSAVARAISDHLAAGSWDAVVATRDHHVDPGDHFSNDPDFIDSWPAHCVAGTPGASFHPDLDIVPIEEVFSKGAHEAAYSGFQGISRQGTPLADWLRERGITKVEICGIATDHCVRATALDAAREGLETTVRLDLTAGVAPDTTRRAIAEMQEAGVTTVGEPA